MCALPPYACVWMVDILHKNCELERELVTLFLDGKTHFENLMSNPCSNKGINPRNTSIIN